MKPNEKLQPIREMATTLGINPNTVKKAYEELESIGAIVTISTKGTFVADNTQKVLEKKIEQKLNLIREEIQELEKMGLSKEMIMKKIEQ